MHRSFLDIRARQAPLPGQPGRFRLFLGQLGPCYLTVMLFALTCSAPVAISAQTNEQRQTRSEVEALAEAARLNEEVVRLYQVGRANEALPLAKSALAIRREKGSSLLLTHFNFWNRVNPCLALFGSNFPMPSIMS